MKRVINSSIQFENNTQGDGTVMDLSLSCYASGVDVEGYITSEEDKIIGYVVSYNMSDYDDTLFLALAEGFDLVPEYPSSDPVNYMIFDSCEKAQTASRKYAPDALRWFISYIGR